MSRGRKAWNAFKAAVTSPTAVKQERSLAVFIATRILLAVGATEGLVKIVQALGA